MIFEKKDSLHFSFEIEDARVAVIATGSPQPQSELGLGNYLHSHAGYELHVVKEGDATVSTDSVSYKLSKGDFLIIPPKQHHYGIAAEGSCVRISLCFSFEKTKGGKESGHYETPEKAFESIRQPIKFSGTQKSFALFDRLFDTLFSKRKYSDSATKACLSLFLLDIAEALDAMDCRLDTDGCTNEKKTKPVHDITRSVMEEYVTENFKKKPSLAKLSRLVHLSEKHTARIFLREFGVPFKKYILGIRMELAKHLLSATAMSVEEIAECTGYGTYNGFYRLFVSETGISPLKYRSMQQKHKKEDQNNEKHQRTFQS